MASSPVLIFSAVLLVSAVGWVLFVFASRLLTWFLSRILGASVGFRVTGCNCLRDVTIKFRKGSVESLSIGEIKLSFRKSLVKLGFGFISRDPKLQLLICDFEVVLQSSERNTKKEKSQLSRSGGRRKWMILTSIARFLSVSVVELTVKVPKAVVEIRDLMIDISKNGGSNPFLNIKMHIVPLLVYIGDSILDFGQSSCDQLECPLVKQACSSLLETSSAPFVCENLSIACEFSHDREAGVTIRNLDTSSGVISICLNEDLLQKPKKSDKFVDTNSSCRASVYFTLEEQSQKKKFSPAALKKQMLIFPEKVSLNMPKLDVKFMHRGHGLVVANNITGMHLTSSKSHPLEESGEAASHYDFQLDFNEIHIFRENTISILEIMKVVLTASLDIPVVPSLPVRIEIDVKLGGTQCNVIMSRLKPWLYLQLSKKKTKNLLRDNPQKGRSQIGDATAVLWTCTASAPEMTVLLHSLNGVPLYYGCSQSSHLFANNIACKGIQVHGELGELHLHMADEYQECLKENLFAVETNSISLVHVARVSLDQGFKEIDSDVNEMCKWNSEFNVDISGVGVNFGFKHVETLMSTMMSFKALFKSSGKGAERKASRSSKSGLIGTKITKLNLEKCSINFFGDVNVEDSAVADPKQVNFGSQGGEVIINTSSDGTPRRACIISNLPNGCKNLHFSISLDVSILKLFMEKEKESTRVDIERARSIYQEYIGEQNLVAKVTLFDLQNGKFVRRSGGVNEISICSLFSATNITIRWEPDIHLALHEIVTRVTYIITNKNLHPSDYETQEESLSVKNKELEKTTLVEQVLPEKQYRKRESVFAIDVEHLRFSAELGDGVESMVYVKSIFSENAKIGVLLEGLLFSINNARVLRSSRMQISRFPIPVSNCALHYENEHTLVWDWVIQGSDILICMPFRLQLRAIDDAFEDMLRALKLISSSRNSILFPMEKDCSKKVKTKPAKVGSVRFKIHNLLADIEEEPIQGWLDEHYQLLKNEVCDLAVRLKFLDDILNGGTEISGTIDLNSICSERKFHHNGVEFESVGDSSVIQSLREEIQRQAFRSYYQACQNIVPSDGSGACTGFQGGFKPSIGRASLLSLRVENLDATLTKIEGGSTGMIEFIRKVDPVSLDYDIPFSRLYGRDIALQAKSLIVQLRNYTFPLFSATDGKCQGRVVLAQQATCFQPQIMQDVFIGRWRRVCMLRSAGGTTPGVKTYTDLPISFCKGEFSFGVGYEPAFADISYACTVALRRANLSIRSATALQSTSISSVESQPHKKERSLPWWDDMRYYIHGKICLSFLETKWNLLATTNPYEKLDNLQIVSGYMNIQQSDGHVWLSSKEFKVHVSSLDSLVKNCSLKQPHPIVVPFLDCPVFSLDVSMDWVCESGKALNHYLHALPNEGKPRQKVYDPFRSTSLSLKWNFSLKPHPDGIYPINREYINMRDRSLIGTTENVANVSVDSGSMNLGAHDIAWVFKWWNLYYNPPHKLRSFSRWPRFGIPRAARSGNLSLDKVMTEFFLRLDSTPACIKHMPLLDDDPSTGLTFTMAKLKYELCYSRGKQRYTIDCKREPLDLVYQGLDLHMLKGYLNRRDTSSIVRDISIAKKGAHSAADKINSEKCNYMKSCTERNQDDGFLLYSDYFTIRRQAPKADPTRLLAWQDAGRKNLEMTYVHSEFENDSESDHTRSDPSDDDGFNVVIADNCQRIFIYGLKLLWTIENRDAVWSWVHGISQAFEPAKPSPSWQYTQRKLFEEHHSVDTSNLQHDGILESSINVPNGVSVPSAPPVEISSSHKSSPTKFECSSSSTRVKHEDVGFSPEGTRHLMVNVVQPQFNLHSDEANGRFLLAAASGRVLARSFRSVLNVGYEMIEQALGTGFVHVPESEPEMTWKHMELSVMLEHVQAHVAPTDIDPGAGLQWLPKILRSSPKIKRTGALLERVFMPCQMYFRYTRHKGGTADLKVKPLKELSFNSPNITATMTSRQFQVMLDVLSNLLFARLPKPRKSSLSYPSEDDDYIEEEADEVVPDGVEEVELAKINLEKRERERKLLIDDIHTISVTRGTSGDLCLSPDCDADLWMITGGKQMLIQGLKRDLGKVNRSRKAASSALRFALQKAAQLRLTEKEKNKSPSYAMRISMRISKVVWSMLADGKTFAETEINDMIYDFDRDYKDIGVALFTTKSFVVKNCLPNVKSDMLLSAWNAPPEWGKNVMLRVDAKQGVPKDGSSLLELFQVEIYPLKIHLTEAMYRMMWDYFFPEEEQDSQRRQEFWKVSTTSGTRHARRSASGYEASGSNIHFTREFEAPGKFTSTFVATSTDGVNQSTCPGDSNQGSKFQNINSDAICNSSSELRRTSSFDRTWEENIAENVANELVLQAHSSGISSKKTPVNSTVENQQALYEETSKIKPKDSKMVKSSRLSSEEKKVVKSHDEKRVRVHKMMEFHNIKISQVELLVTYEGSRFAVNDLRLLMDTFHRVDFTGTWRRLFSRVKKHIIWSVLKSVTGMQGKKFKDKVQSQREVLGSGIPDSDLIFSDSDGGQPDKPDQYPITWLKRPSDGAGDGFVTSIKGLFNSQRRKAKAFVLRTMRGEADNEFHGEWSESDVEFSPFARQLTITKAKKLIRRHTKKFRSRGQKHSGWVMQRESLPSSPHETAPCESDSSGASSYEDFKDLRIASDYHHS